VSELLLDIQGTEFSNKQTIVDLCCLYVVAMFISKHVEFLAAREFCSDFFSIILLRGNKNVGEIVKIPKTMLSKLAGVLLVALSVARDDTRDYISELITPALKEFFDLLGCEPVRSDMLDVCRVLAHLLDLGLVCYVGSHGSQFD
jgi:hypothetical protein